MAKRNPYAKFQLDAEIVKAGVAYEDDDVRITVTYAGSENTKYDKLLKARLKAYDVQIRNDSLSDDIFNRVLAEVYADTIILDWESRNDDGEWVKGIYDEEGAICEITKTMVCKAFTLAPRLFSDVIKVATNFNLYRQGLLDGDIKN